MCQNITNSYHIYQSIFSKACLRKNNKNNKKNDEENKWKTK